MANQPEVATYDAGIYQWELADPVEGGVGNIANAPLLSLANRTGWLKAQLASLSTLVAALAPLNSPAFTGTGTVPTAAPGTNNTVIANTAFAQFIGNGLASVSCAGGATVTLTSGQWGAAIVVLTGLLTANINVIFPTQSGKWIVDNTTTGTFSVTCKTAAGTGVVVPQAAAEMLFCDDTNIVLASADQPHGTQAFASAGTFTFTVPPGVTAVDAEVQGAGGGSGVANGTQFSGCGGAGGYSRKRITGLVPGATVTVTVGAAGAVGALPTGNGGPGGTSSFGAFNSATGGTGGGISIGGGPGGSGVGGDVNLTGGFGSDGNTSGTGPGQGLGGASFFGGGGRDGVAGGTIGQAPGSGAGAPYGSTPTGGSPGAVGIVIVRW
jgi:hypothetical protein